jgi:hypothetical protein
MGSMKFRSKVDAWLAIVLFGVVGFQLWAAFSLVRSGTPAAWTSVPLLLLGSAFIVWIFATTSYVITDTELLVRSGPVRRRIPLVEIRTIVRTRNPLSSPALSLDRLAISYGAGGFCMVSPSDREGFLEALRTRGVAAAQVFKECHHHALPKRQDHAATGNIRR